MFNPLKLLKTAMLPKPAFITPSGGGTAPQNDPSDIFADSKWTDTPKPRLLNRVLEGLPGFLGGAGFMAATKCTTAALCSTVSAPALVTGAAVLGVGAFASQTLTYIRERKAYLNDAAEIAAAMDSSGNTQIQKASILRNLFNGAAIKREARAFGAELTSAHFWKGFATKGVIAGGLGAAFGALAANDTVQEYAHKAVDAVKGWKLPSFKMPWSAKPPVPAAPVASPNGTTGLGTQSVSGKVIPLAEAAAPAPAPVAKEPVTLIEKARALFAGKGVNAEAAEKILNNTQLTEAQRVKDIAYGAGNGKLGFEVNTDAAKAAMKLAADNGNAQAIRDLALNGKPLPTPTLSSAPAFTGAAAAAEPVTIPGDGLSPREIALADAAKAVPVPAEPQVTTAFGNAGGCEVTAKVTGLDVSANSTCENLKPMMQTNDSYTIRTADGSLQEDYYYDGETPIKTDDFRADVLLNFIRTKIAPALN